MTPFKLAFRSLFQRNRNNLVKIVSLGAGLSVGLVLIAKVLHEQSYDRFYPEADRIYQVIQNYRILIDETDKIDEDDVDSRVPPGVVRGMREDMAGIESITLTTPFARNTPLLTQDRKRLRATILLADSCFFDVVPRPMVAGDAKQTLGRSKYVLISESFAAKMDGNPLGQEMEMDGIPDRRFTVGGIFRDLPKNSSLQYDILLSLETVTDLWHWDPRNIWDGNERWHVFFKPVKGVTMAKLSEQMKRLQEKHLPAEMLEEAGVEVEFKFFPFTEMYRSSNAAIKNNTLLALLAVALLVAAVLNYVLIVLSTLSGRFQEMAVYKCYGANNMKISLLVFIETALHLFLSLCLAAGLLLLFRNTVEELLAAPLSTLFTGKNIAVLSGICAGILLLAAWFPSRLFAGIPVASVFRRFTGGSRRSWKWGLLFFQFTGATFLLVLLLITGRQYQTMVTDHPGYEYDRVAYLYLGVSDSIKRQTLLDKIHSIPEVETAATGSGLFLDIIHSHNVVYRPGQDGDEELFYFVDLYYVDENYLKLFRIPLLQGTHFSPQSISQKEVLVSRAFAERLEKLAGWEDGVVGKEIRMSEHRIVTIRGVYENIRIGRIGLENTRPSVLFYSSQPSDILFVRLNRIDGEAMTKLTRVVQEVFPDKQIPWRWYAEQLISQYQPVLRYRNSVLIGSVVTLVIVLMGLIGYLRNEIQRRSKEIAIRKVNGARSGYILSLFLRDLYRIAVPAALVGAVVAGWVARKWMEGFSVKTPLSVWLFLAYIVVILAVISVVILIYCWQIARKNPVDSLKNE